MSDVEKLRQDVINAAREVTDMPAGSLIPQRLNLVAYQCLASSVAALDEAEKPDPWMLLRYVDNRIHSDWSLPGGDPLPQMIDAALAWKEAQQ